MRKWKSICLQYKKYEQVHKENIMLEAFKMQLRANPNSRQVRFLRNAAKRYCLTNFPTEYRQMEESDWDDVAKRLSAMWQQEKNINDKFANYREAYPSFFWTSNQEKSVSVKTVMSQVKLPFDIDDVDVATLAEPAPLVDVQKPFGQAHMTPKQQAAYDAAKAQVDVTPVLPTKKTAVVPPTDDMLTKMLSMFSSATMTTPDGTKIQFQK